ncbi:Chromodomain-helicase-DNA-binding protein 4 [Morus notabilis]|uniref:Chromodomain-helicase-DNA-binding protein 4 n=1 Tax=Morus notabilis TaxID=981085 RepID=W9QL17_9ROSA|nr:increased DNA methylation 1 [Morus notabilis]EXB39829.1 Chromodomain-helicase-DNA-binding protein 4 [Morus notabilis]
MKILEKKGYLEVPKEFCPQAVIEWYKFGAQKGHKNDLTKSDVREKARNHLSFLGWRFWYGQKQNRMELRYTSPSGKNHYSLRTACQACIDGGMLSESVASNALIVSSEEGSPRLFPGKVNDLSREKENSSVESSSTTVSSTESTKGRKRRRNADQELENSQSVQIQPSEESEFSDFHVDQNGSITDSNSENPSPSRGKRVIAGLTDSRGSKPIRGKKVVSDLKNSCKRRSPNNNSHERVRIRIANIPVSSSRRRNVKSVLSLLIDNNVVVLGAKVHYRGKEFSGGVLTREGIVCDCCSKVFALTAYEEHVGSTNHRPAANILLEDGRSLMDCKNQIRSEKRTTMVTGQEENSIDRDESDDMCSVCHYGGELVLCDSCPSACHVKCLGFERAPDGDWFCPSCRCGICGQGKLEEARTESCTSSIDHVSTNDDNGVLICHQCERKFHMGCLKNAGVDLGLEKGGSRENLFCSRKCEDVCSGLRKIVGKRIPVGEEKDNLTWTLLKATENDTKLENSFLVMHECFEPAKDPLTNRDIVEDVFFGRESKLSRLNFRGFYIVVLEKDDDLVTVATVRVYGEKLAEVPLVGTRFEYRRRGMCRVLMNELEKQLVGLGVERLALPSASSVLQTWTTSFGFSVVTRGEKLQFLSYNLLDFQGTFMCQKRLIEKTSEAKSSISEGNSPTEVVDHVDDLFLSEEDMASLHSILGSL